MPKQGHLSTERHKRGSGSKHARRLVGAESGDSESHKPAEKPISLRPLEFEEAVSSLLKVRHIGDKGGSGGRRPKRSGAESEGRGPAQN